MMHRAHAAVVTVAVLALGMILATEKPSMEPARTAGYAMLQRSRSVGSFQQEPAAASTAAPSAAAAKTAPAGPPVAPAPNGLVLKKCVAEFLAMALFVIIGCGSAMSIAKESGSAWVLQVSLTFGFAITVLAYTIGHYSGGQINCAVTFGLVLAGEVSLVQGLGNLVAQMFGSVVGAGILWIMYARSSTDKSLDKTGGLGTNVVGDDWPIPSVILAEFLGTFVLMYVVLETAVNPTTAGNSVMAPVAIGLAVFLAHSVLVPIDGCSINPTRSFGPALVNMIHDSKAAKQLWIFTVGPLLGAAAAVGAYRLMGKV